MGVSGTSVPNDQRLLAVLSSAARNRSPMAIAWPWAVSMNATHPPSASAGRLLSAHRRGRDADGHHRPP